MAPSLERRITALWASFVGDALAMPVHWYYDRAALQRDYGPLEGFCAPRNPHPDSILWRSQPEPRAILHSQAVYWGQPGIHYHQFLKAGENTLNLQLVRLLLQSLQDSNGYTPEDYLQRYLRFFATPDSHRDTYVEECHRNFFRRHAQGIPPERCGAEDIHIGGLAPVPALACFLAGSPANAETAVRSHVGLTHRSAETLEAATGMTRLLLALFSGTPLETALAEHASHWFSLRRARSWAGQPDSTVIGNHLSPACYLRDALPATLYLAWKYAGNLRAGLLANARVGGDNCHRGVLLGAILGAVQPGGLPNEWKNGLLCADFLSSVRFPDEDPVELPAPER